MRCRDQCRSAGLAVSGTKEELADRLFWLEKKTKQDKLQQQQPPPPPPKAPPATFSERKAVPEPLCIRMGVLPLKSGPARLGSLRVTTAGSGGTPREAARLLQLNGSTGRSRAVKVIPRTPLAISLLRHETVFAADSLATEDGKAARCPSCREPAECFELNGRDANPVEAYLKNCGLDVVKHLTSDMPPNSKPMAHPLMRVCRKGCLTCEVCIDDLAISPIREKPSPARNRATVSDASSEGTL